MPESCNMMMGGNMPGMMGTMWLAIVLVFIFLVLGIAALSKYLFFSGQKKIQ